MRGLSLVVASGGHSSSRCAGLSPSRPLLLWSTGSRCAGSVVVAHGPSRSAACGILPDQGSNPCPLHWQADSQPLHHQGSPIRKFLNKPNLLLLRDVSWLLVSQLYLVIYNENNFTCDCLQKCLFSLCPIKRLFSFQLFSSQIFSDHLSLDQLFGNMVEWEVLWGSSPATYLFVKITRENVSNPFKHPFQYLPLRGSCEQNGQCDAPGT